MSYKQIVDMVRLEFNNYELRLKQCKSASEYRQILRVYADTVVSLSTFPFRRKRG